MLAAWWERCCRPGSAVDKSPVGRWPRTTAEYSSGVGGRGADWSGMLGRMLEEDEGEVRGGVGSRDL